MRKVTMMLAISISLTVLFIAPVGHSETINFDALNPGDIVTTIQGVTFSSNIAGYMKLPPF